jgi:hypothetical protein
MKSILLTTTAIVAFAGAAAAENSFGGGASLGYNDDIENGFYWDADVSVTLSQELDNGLTASATFGFDVVEDNLGQPMVAADYVLAVESDMAALRFGDLDPVAEANYGGVSGDTTTGFADQSADFDAMLVGEATVGDITAMMSYGVALGGGVSGDKDLDALQVYVSGSFGMVDAEFGYQGEYDGSDAVLGVSASTTAAGADITGAYLTDGTETSMGIAVAYPVGDVTVSGYYSLNDVAEDSYGLAGDYAAGAIAVNAFYDFTGGATSESGDDTKEFGVEGSYDVGNGLTVLAGFISTTVDENDATTQMYAAGVYDLGGGAELLVSYADNEANPTDDEVGSPKYLHGTTVEVSFSF